MKAMNTRKIRNFKFSQTGRFLSMLTCYDFQTAEMLNETDLDLILVGDSLGNVVLGYDTTVSVSLEEMITFSAAVKRGASDKFVIADLPFGTYASLESGLTNAIKLFQQSQVQALKLEGAYNYQLELIERLTQNGIPIMGHIGLTPQSVHEQGGYYTHGKDANSKSRLINQARELEQAGVFAVVLECVTDDVAEEITNLLSIPTIGIGAGLYVDGQVLVINDLLKNGKKAPPQFCTPVADLFDLKKSLISQYLEDLNLNPKQSDKVIEISDQRPYS